MSDLNTLKNQFYSSVYVIGNPNKFIWVINGQNASCFTQNTNENINNENINNVNNFVFFNEDYNKFCQVIFNNNVATIIYRNNQHFIYAPLSQNNEIININCYYQPTTCTSLSDIYEYLLNAGCMEVTSEFDDYITPENLILKYLQNEYSP